MEHRKHHKKNRKFKKNPVLLAAILLVLILALVAVFFFVERLIDRANGLGEADAYTEAKKSWVMYEDKWYSKNDSISSVLVMGIDSIQSSDESRLYSSQADFLALLIIDDENESFKILHINRDTMADIAQLDEYGREYGSFKAQLALAHTYGGEDRIRCRNTVDAVENLLYGVGIEHFLSLTMDTVPILNDSIGGVEVELAEDFTALGDSALKGSTVTLKGDQALTFVRWRGNEGTESNLNRMERQRQYIGALFEKYAENDPDDTLGTLMKVSKYLVSDCTVNQLASIIERLQDYTYEGTVTLKGEAVLGEEYIEYYIDETAAQETVLELFYELEE